MCCEIFENIVFIPRTYKYILTNIFYFPHKNNVHSLHPNQHTVAHSVKNILYTVTVKKKKKKKLCCILSSVSVWPQHLTSNAVTLHHNSILGPYNTTLIICFLNTLHDTEVQDRSEQPQFVVFWGNVSFYWAALVRDWFINHNRFIALNLPPYTPFFRIFF